MSKKTGAAIAHGNENFAQEDWMQIKTPEVLVKFPIESLVSRRSFVFARAGFGKSNLNKLLFSKLYEHTPTVKKRADKAVPVGTVIFDPDGEYFWPDDKGRPGLCDVPHLQEKLVVFTSRKNPSPFYQSFVAGGIKLDIRRLRPSDVIAIALPPDKQDQQNVRKLRGLSQDDWAELVNQIHDNGNATPLEIIHELLDLEERQEAEALAARGNMTTIVRMLHDKSSQLMDMLIHALSQGKLCVIDVSQMRGGQALVLSGLILRRIFDRNQAEFTTAEANTIPVIAVVEEAQSVLNEKASAAEPYIAWVKEGRKYDLGAVLITQQPGSIPAEILSQGDNWFIFHLLSAADLTSVKKANAHFSDDLLSSLLNEPIPGQGVFWSSVGGKPYPVSLRVHLFEHLYKPLDTSYNKPSVKTFAHQLKAEFQAVAGRPVDSTPKPAEPNHKNELKDNTAAKTSHEDETVDVLEQIENAAIEALQKNKLLISKIEGEGAAWGSVKAFFLEVLPKNIDDRDAMAYRLVAKAMDKIYGPQKTAWHTFKQDRKTYVKKS